VSLFSQKELMKVALFEKMPPMLKLVEERLDGDFILQEVSYQKTRTR